MMGWKISVPFRTTKVCYPNWDLAKYSFVQKISSSDGPVAKYSILMPMARVGIQCATLLFFHNDIVGSPGSIPGTGIVFVS
jgi:hypothetical protein